MQNLIEHATMALTDVQGTSYESPRMGRPRLVSAEWRAARQGSLWDAEQHKNEVFVRRTATIGAKKKNILQILPSTFNF